MYLFKIFNKSIKSVVKQQNYLNYVPRRHYKDVPVDDIPDVSVSVIRNLLKKTETKYTEGYTNFVIGCPVCEKHGESLVEKTKIFINKKTGSFSCETCMHTGPWMDINTYISAKKNNKPVKRDPVIEKELAILNEYIKLVKRNTKLISSFTSDEYKEILLKFMLPEVPHDIMSTLGIRLDLTHTNMYIPLMNSALEIVGYKLINCKTNLGAIEPKLKNTFSTGVIISKTARAKDAAVVVVDISDFFVLVSAGVPYTIICLPTGLNHLSQHTLPCFDQYSKLILWFPNDITAFDTARTFSKKLGEKRCLFVRSVDKIELPHIEPNQNFKAIISSAQAIWHKSITTFSSLREDVLADLMNIERVQGIKWNRFPTLNRILKGHRRGELTVFTGPTGSGKTTFISEYSLDLAMQGVNTLWGSFEIRNARLARTMLQQMSGCLLDQNLDKYDYWADQFEQLPIYYMTFHGQQTIKVVMEAIEHAVYVHDIAHVIIDNLQFMMGTSEDTKSMDRFWKQDIIVSHFRTFATRRNCHVTLVIHPRKEKTDEDLTMSSIFGGAKASQEADNILIIQDKRMVSVKGKKYLQIFKNRYCGDLGIMPLDFDKTSLSFAPKKKKELEKKSDADNG